MDMKKEDFVSLECAKLLKEKGYNEHCANRYVIPIAGTEREEWDDEECIMCTKQDCEIYPNTTIYEAQKWLRNNKGFHIEINVFNASIWGGIIYKYDENGIANSSYVYGSYQSYEDALNTGIIEALKMI